MYGEHGGSWHLTGMLLCVLYNCTCAECSFSGIVLWKHLLMQKYKSEMLFILSLTIYYWSFAYHTWCHWRIIWMEFFLNVFTEFSKFSDKKYLSLKGLEPATSCVRDQDAITAPARQMWETGSLNWDKFMLQWFIRFPDFSEFNESSVPFRKNSNETFEPKYFYLFIFYAEV